MSGILPDYLIIVLREKLFDGDDANLFLWDFFIDLKLTSLISNLISILTQNQLY